MAETFEGSGDGAITKSGGGGLQAADYLPAPLLEGGKGGQPEPRELVFDDSHMGSGKAGSSEGETKTKLDPGKTESGKGPRMPENLSEQELARQAVRTVIQAYHHLQRRGREGAP